MAEREDSMLHSAASLRDLAAQILIDCVESNRYIIGIIIDDCVDHLALGGECAFSLREREAEEFQDKQFIRRVAKILTFELRHLHNYYVCWEERDGKLWMQLQSREPRGLRRLKYSPWTGGLYLRLVRPFAFSKPEAVELNEAEEANSSDEKENAPTVEEEIPDAASLNADLLQNQVNLVAEVLTQVLAQNMNLPECMMHMANGNVLTVEIPLEEHLTAGQIRLIQPAASLVYQRLGAKGYRADFTLSATRVLTVRCQRNAGGTDSEAPAQQA